jgi:hypothetical protein
MIYGTGEGEGGWTTARTKEIPQLGFLDVVCIYVCIYDIPFMIYWLEFCSIMELLRIDYIIIYNDNLI